MSKLDQVRKSNQDIEIFENIPEDYLYGQNNLAGLSERLFVRWERGAGQVELYSNPCGGVFVRCVDSVIWDLLIEENRNVEPKRVKLEAICPGGSKYELNLTKGAIDSLTKFAYTGRFENEDLESLIEIISNVRRLGFTETVLSSAEQYLSKHVMTKRNLMSTWRKEGNWRDKLLDEDLVNHTLSYIIANTEEIFDASSFMWLPRTLLSMLLPQRLKANLDKFRELGQKCGWECRWRAANEGTYMEIRTWVLSEYLYYWAEKEAMDSINMSQQSGSQPVFSVADLRLTLGDLVYLIHPSPSYGALIWNSNDDHPHWLCMGQYYCMLMNVHNAEAENDLWAVTPAPPYASKPDARPSLKKLPMEGTSGGSTKKRMTNWKQVNPIANMLRNSSRLLDKDVCIRVDSRETVTANSFVLGLFSPVLDSHFLQNNDLLKNIRLEAFSLPVFETFVNAIVSGSLTQVEHAVDVGRLACYFKTHRVLSTLLPTLRSMRIEVANAGLVYTAGNVCGDTELKEAALGFLKRNLLDVLEDGKLGEIEDFDLMAILLKQKRFCEKMESFAVDAAWRWCQFQCHEKENQLKLMKRFDGLLQYRLLPIPNLINLANLGVMTMERAFEYNRERGIELGKNSVKHDND